MLYIVFFLASDPGFVSSSCMFLDERTLLQIGLKPSFEEPGPFSLFPVRCRIRGRGKGEGLGSLFKHEANLVPRSSEDTGNEVGRKRVALWDGEESFCVESSFTPWFIILA